MVNDGTAASPPSPVTTSTSTLPLPMTTTSRHYFGASSSAEDHDFYIDIIENMQEDYGMFVWPCSIILAEYVWQQKLQFSNATVVELGAGTSLPGLVAAKVGADVILTDSSNRVEIMGLSWGEWDAPLFDLHPQIVLGADVLYDTTDFDNLFATVTFLLENSPGGHHLIEFLMAKWGLKCSKLLDGFSFIPLCKASSLQGNIQLVEIMLDGSKPK